MRDLDNIEGGQALQTPQRLYERLAQLSGYTWDQSIQPFHSVRMTRLDKYMFTDLLGPDLRQLACLRSQTSKP